MYVQICIFMYMYIACTYMFMPVRNFVNMYIHVCTMYRDVCTDLPILVQVVRIPDEPLGIAKASIASIGKESSLTPGRSPILCKASIASIGEERSESLYSGPPGRGRSPILPSPARGHRPGPVMGRGRPGRARGPSRP
jgi:hypothetical protein